MRFAGVDASVLENYEGGGWATEGAKQDPAAGALLADTGAVLGGLYDFTIMLNVSNAMSRGVLLQHRDPFNAANQAEQVIGAAANPPEVFHIRSYKMASSERLRMVTRADYAGNIQASIIWTFRSRETW